eukprot:14922834-Ditylum_brightwellii.AAC.1
MNTNPTLQRSLKKGSTKRFEGKNILITWKTNVGMIGKQHVNYTLAKVLIPIGVFLHHLDNDILKTTYPCKCTLTLLREGICMNFIED